MYQRTKSDLLDELRDQAIFLRRSSESFDEGHEGEAKRLAATLRLMIHDHGRSKSLLGQLEVKEKMLFLDTAEPINPRNLAPTPGLAMMQLVSDGKAGEGRYVPRCKQPPLFASRDLRFQPWWKGDVAKDAKGELFSRRDFVMTVANKDGGAHVDPALNAAYADLTRNNSMGWMVSTGGTNEEVPFGGNIAFVCVRQIAYEVQETLQRDFGDLAGDVVQLGRLATQGVGRNHPCPCGKGLKFKKCHGQ